MGLLDDAIREHLELKRVRGADPQELARQEDDALGTEAGAAKETVEQSTEAGSSTDEARPGEPGGGQETVELDMDSVLDRDPLDGATAVDAREPSGKVETMGGSGSQDSLEWEMPGDRSSDVETDQAEAEAVEDVLEKTPDFLRETPEQERLWFEQRPPRDFDFNE